jgi:hypothetical protein
VPLNPNNPSAPGVRGDEFDMDARNKLGAEVNWEDDDFADYIDALNSGSAVLPVGLARVADAPGEIELTADDLLRLKSLIAGYR